MNATATEATAPAAGVKTKAPVEQVTMTDGRVVDFVGKRKMLKESLFPEGGLPQIRIDFRNGETRLFQLQENLLHRYAGHGAEQKLGDETAGTDDVDDMVLEVDELWGRLEKGEWSTRREGSGMAGTSILLKALVEFSKKTTDEVKAFLTGKSQAEKLALRASPQLKPIVDRLEAEKVAKVAKIDTGALLAGLESPAPAAVEG